jgi:hypothetical protein
VVTAEVNAAPRPALARCWPRSHAAGSLYHIVVRFFCVCSQPPCVVIALAALEPVPVVVLRALVTVTSKLSLAVAA